MKMKPWHQIVELRPGLAEGRLDMKDLAADLHAVHEGKAVEDYLDSEAEIEVKDGAILYQGEYVHNLVVDKILSFMRNSLPYKPLVKFLSKLMENPSSRSVNELYKFFTDKHGKTMSFSMFCTLRPKWCQTAIGDHALHQLVCTGLRLPSMQELCVLPPSGLDAT